MRLSLLTCSGFRTRVGIGEVTRWGLFLRRGVHFLYFSLQVCCLRPIYFQPFDDAVVVIAFSGACNIEVVSLFSQMNQASLYILFNDDTIIIESSTEAVRRPNVVSGCR